MLRESYWTPFDQDDGVTELQGAVLGLLEDAGIDTETNDAVLKLICAAEQEADATAAYEQGGNLDVWA